MSKNILKKLIKLNTQRNIEAIFEDYEKKTVIKYSNEEYEKRKNILLHSPDLKNKLINEIANKTCYYIDNMLIDKKDSQDLLEKDFYTIIDLFLDLIILD